MQDQVSREKQIVRASAIGIAANVALSASKAVIGAVSGSIAIVLDAVNNLSDVLSAAVTLAGTKMASKPADKEHPFGHGRIEYITTILVAFVIAGAGVSFLFESIDKLKAPSPGEYGVVSLCILALAIAVKVVLSMFYRRVGKRVDSETLTDTGVDAGFDALITSATLVCALVEILSDGAVPWLDGALGVAISLVIVRSGVKMMLSPLSGLVGGRAKPELIEQIRKEISAQKDVLGVYDLMLHDYGPQRHMGSFHIEVDDSMTAHRIHDLSRHLQKSLEERYGVHFTIGIYACNSRQCDPETEKMRSHITSMLMSCPGVMQVHGLYIDPCDKTISFDTVLKFGLEDSHGAKQRIWKLVHDAYPSYTIDNGIDYDYSITK